MTTTVSVRKAKPIDYLRSPRVLGPQGESRGLSLDLGYLLAESEDQIVGCLGWRVENLVARLEDLRVLEDGPVARETILRELLSTMEQAAHVLECEVSLLSLPQNESDALGSCLETAGYSRETSDGLTRHHKEAAEELAAADRVLWVRRLREGRVTRPL